MSALTYRQAVARAIAEEMRRDARVVLIGEDVAEAGGVFKATEGLLAEFGSDRVRDTPISEQALVGAAIGAALVGLRPIVDLMFADFAGVAFDQLANQLAKYRYMSGGRAATPVTVRLCNGAGLGFGAQHSQPTENWFLNVPGLRLVVPATPRDMLGLLRSAIRSDDPVLVFEHKALYSISEDLPDGEDVLVPLGSGVRVRAGRDITVVATQVLRHRAVAAAEELASRGIEIEVIDPRSLSPLDWPLIAESVSRTRRLLVVQEGPMGGSWGATLVARTVAECFVSLRAAPMVLASPDTPVPFAGTLEGRWVPTQEDIEAACTGLVGAPGPRRIVSE